MKIFNTIFFQMAIWQYDIIVLPENEVESYFGNQNYLNMDDIDNIDWWKDIQLESISFSNIKYFLPLKNSWSNEIILFGSEDSNNIEIIHSNYKVDEITMRIDLRDLNKDMINSICIFFSNNNCLFINYKGKVIYPNVNQLTNDIEKYNVYKDFLEFNRK